MNYENLFPLQSIRLLCLTWPQCSKFWRYFLSFYAMSSHDFSCRQTLLFRLSSRKNMIVRAHFKENSIGAMNVPYRTIGYI